MSGKKFGKTLTSIAASTMQNLQTHSWPGNVREVANVIERSVIYSQGSVLRIVDRFEQTLDEPPSPVKSLQEVEKEHIISLLEQTGWRIEGPSGAAHLLGLKPSTLRARMAKLGIERRGVKFAEAIPTKNGGATATVWHAPPLKTLFVQITHKQKQST